jgi:hypothetical protein
MRNVSVLCFFAASFLTIAMGEVLLAQSQTDAKQKTPPAPHEQSARGHGTFQTRGTRAARSDARLLSFGRTHPHCQLWTNWHKVCSRTGAHGATTCFTDPDRPVAPSEPFCTAADSPSSETVTPAQIASYSRFCHYQAAPGIEPFRICAGPEAEERPFNGRRIAARLHPWCEIWADERMRPVCQSGNVAGLHLRQCGPLARQGFEAPTRLQCVRRSVPSWCEEAGLLGNGPEYPYSGTMIMLGYTTGPATVVGVYCERR